MNLLEIDNSFEGANPFKNYEIKQIDSHSIKVVPFCEDEMVAYKFRLDLKLVNSGDKDEKVTLIVDWKDHTYNHLRDTLYLKTTGQRWKTINGLVNGQKITASIELPPGKSYLTLNPKYDLNDQYHFLKNISEDHHLKKKTIGYTPGNRPIWIVKTGIGKKTILISARVHPYETAPSFIIEGIIDYLGSRAGLKIFNEFNFVVIPMMAPDGVAEGCCRMSSLKKGVDLSREISSDDKLTNIYLKLIDEIKPALYLELHNWMFRDVDGMFYLNGYDSFRLKQEFKKHMNTKFRKKWKIGLNFPFRALKPGGLKWYCKQIHEAKVLTLEIPWFGRTTTNMHDFGRIVPIALSKIL